MLNIISTLILIALAGCVTNPKYDNVDSSLEEQIRKNPQHAEQIRKYKKDFELQKNSEIAGHPNNKYIIISEKTSGWAVGNPNAAFMLGENTYVYIHKIGLTLLCNKDSFVPIPIQKQKIKWKINESIFGESMTTIDGRLDITFNSNKDTEPFKYIEIQTLKNTYQFMLSGLFIFQTNLNDCQ